ncbi:heavy metal translocating P-type ATPase [Lactococcus lactis]|uniref:heavy metal translocating P-type ATPase n=1 Tax=Lactococcus lactis TaxID=1358 RepID=UPI00288D70C7|nr:heavy metal translocating P-type ATPase [Lactococcus lactis]MDT2879482.1 heavy metal translocating P-type ATPase [Lactococcus lactis]
MNKKFTSLLLLSSVILITTADKIRAKADTTDSSIEQQENIINEAQSAKDKSLSDISLLQSKIDSIRVEKNKTEQKISEIKKQAQNLNNKIEELSKNIEKRTDVLESQARSAQVNSNATSYVDTIVNSKSLSDIIQRLSAMATISSANKSMLNLQIKEQKDLNNKTGTFTMRVSKDSKDTVFSKILTMVEESQNNLSPTADFIKRFEPYYVNGVLVIFLVLLIFSPMFLGWTLTETISRSLVFLVSASPCALAVAAIPATLAGISSLAKQGILFKGGNFLSNLINLKAVAFDKTGTLTEGKPKVVDFYFNPELDGESFRNTLVAMEKQSNHPLANAIVNKFETQKVDYDIKVKNELGTGLSATYQGENYRIAKPSAFKMVSQEWIEKQENFENEGKTVVFIAANDKVEGLIAIQDTPQKTAISAIQYLNKNQIKTIMLTGDAVLTGKAIGKQLGVRDVQANVMPDEKAKIINENKEKYGPTAMVGDGVNDAPALAVADIGIAMGDGTDVAIETADIVLMKNDLGNFVSAHKTSKRLKKIVTQNIIFALLVVIFLVYISLWKNASVVLSITLHEGSTLVVLLNSLRLLLPNKKV